jgi:GAF domain-containing protein
MQGGAAEGSSERPVSGSGRSADLIRQLQSAALAQDPPQAWPDALSLALNLCLEARIPTAVFWGDDLVEFHNDAFGEMIADRHPAALGQAVARNWPEIWADVKDVFAAVMSTGRPELAYNQRLNVRRHGRLDESFFSYSFSPIRSLDGGVGGVYCTVLETTREVLLHRRTSTLRDVALVGAGEGIATYVSARALGAMSDNPYDIPFAAVYLVDQDTAVAVRVASYGLDVASGVLPDTQDPADLEPWPFAAALSGATFLVNDLSSRFGDLVTGPWPESIREAAMLQLPSYGPDAAAAVLIVGLSPRLAFDPEYQEFLEQLAAQLGTAIESARLRTAERDEAANLRLALETNRRIGAAIGVLMTVHKVTEEQAFNLLRQSSQRSRRKLRDVADEVTRTGSLPE